MTMRWIGTGRSARGAPGPRRSFRLRPLGLLLVALVGLAQTGCQSGFSGFTNPCGSSPCGGCSGGGPCSYLKGLRDRFFNRGARLGTPIGASVVAGGSGCCGESTMGAPMTMGGEAPLEFGTPAVVAPGATPVIPSAPVDSAPNDLSPLPIEKERTPSATPDSTSSTIKSTPGRTSSYDAARPRYSPGENVARAMVSTPEPASRSARGGDRSSESWLDDLPPLSIPRDEARNELPEPAPPASELSERKPTSQPEVQAAVETPVPAAAALAPTPGPAPTPDASTSPATSAAEVSVAPGIQRFVALEPKLSGGSLPTAAGLDWLAEKGYKTILDLRETSQVQPSFIGEVSNRGMRYVALPIGLKQLDAEHVASFNLEISLSNARPLYFCDTDGTRSGALWYIRRLTVDGVDSQAAKHEADELGLVDKDFWAATTTYLNQAKPSSAPAPAASSPVAPDPKDAKSNPSAAAAQPAVALAEPQPVPDAESEPAAPAAVALVEPQLASKVESQPAPPTETITEVAQKAFETQEQLEPRPRDTTVWRTCAAMVVTGLGVPLAYWSRSSLDSLRTMARASLPGPEPKSKSLPPASGD